MSGELVQTIWKDRHLRKHAREPFCTHSQIVVYWEGDDTPIAIVHQYARPDGSLGASGRPDPKKLVVGGRLLAIRVRQAG